MWSAVTLGARGGEGVAGFGLNRGAAVVVGMSGHFVRLQSLTDAGIVVDDPGSWSNSDLKLTWEDALAVGLFWTRVVLTPG